MARFGSVGTQYFDDSGDPLSGGKIYVYETGTTTLKTSYSDAGESVANTNPVILDAAGRQPDIFFGGSAKIVITDSADVQVDVADPVGTAVAQDAFADWVSTITYDADDIVKGSDDKYYQAISGTNLNNNPTSSPTYWQEVRFLALWNSSQTYVVGDVCIHDDNQMYLCKLESTNNEPPNATYWDTITSGGALTTTQMIAGSGLTGGGTLASDRTFNVGAGTGITVNADDVAINLTAGTGIDITGATISHAITGGDALTFTGATLDLDINSLTLDQTPTNTALSYVAYYDSSGVNRKIDIDSLISSGTGFVQESRLVSGGNGLTAGSGGNLSADLSFVVGEGTGISVTTNAVNLDTASTRNTDHTTVSISAGIGLSGGGTIASTRILDLDINGLTEDATPTSTTLSYVPYYDSSGTTYKISIDDLVSSGSGFVPESRTITSGNGLTGGGDLSANRTLAVGAGTGITVNADDVAFSTAWGDARYYTQTTADATFIGSVSADTAPSLGGNIDFVTYTASNFASTGIVDEATSLTVTIDSSDQVGIGTTTPDVLFHVRNAAAGGVYTPDVNTVAVIENNTTSRLQFLGPTNGNHRIQFGSAATTEDGNIVYNGTSNELSISVGGTNTMKIGTASVLPITDNTVDLGSASQAWKDIYYEGTLNDTSDARLKENIVDIPLPLIRDFIDELRPIRFKWKDKNVDIYDGAGDVKETRTIQDDRFFFGITSQDLRDAFIAVGQDPANYAAFVHDAANDKYMVAYLQLIGPMLAMIKDLKARVEALENK